MKFYSTNHQVPDVDLRTAVTKGLADDNGLFMPERIPHLSDEFFKTLPDKSLPEIGFEVASQFFGDDIAASELKPLVDEVLNFDIPLVKVSENIYTLELFHGPTLAFKDVGARFMSRLLSYFTRQKSEVINVLVATSGDTGSAVANGFYKVPGIRVFILYPKGLVSPIQEKQFTTLGENITAIEIDGTFDDCQRLVKQAFLDKELCSAMTLTSANSINLARLLPQSFYYYYGVAQMMKQEPGKKIAISVPSGNFGNICAGLIAKRTGLPVDQFISATNVNDIVPQYLENGKFEPRPSVATIANAMDVGNPSNFVRILDLYGGSHEAITADIIGYSYNDDQIRETIREVYGKYNYLPDPHGAIGYRSLQKFLPTAPGFAGFFLETAHPAKFSQTIEETIGKAIELPERLKKIIEGEKKSSELPSEYEALKSFLLARK
jgi:threonine synthase